MFFLILRRLKEFDEYKLLKRSGARLPIDSLEFIEPILEEHNGCQDEAKKETLRLKPHSKNFKQ
jgi:hypothetical protein